MMKGSYFAALAAAGLLMVGCEGETETTTPQTPPTPTDNVRGQVDDATDAVQRETRELGDAAGELGNKVSEQATAAGAGLSERMDQVLANVDAETRQQFQQLQTAIQQKNWDEARTAASQLNAKRDKLTEQGRQLFDSLRAQIPAEN